MKRCLLLLLGSGCFYSCQPGKAVNFAEVHYTQPEPKVWVQGYVRGWPTDSNQAMLDFVVVFWRRFPDNTVERVVDPSTPKTGKYRVQLTGGYAYYADVMLQKYNCRFSAEEYAISNRPGDTLQLKDFYFPYYDTTSANASGGCTRGWRRSYIKVR